MKRNRIATHDFGAEPLMHSGNVRRPEAATSTSMLPPTAVPDIPRSIGSLEDDYRDAQKAFASAEEDLPRPQGAFDEVAREVDHFVALSEDPQHRFRTDGRLTAARSRLESAKAELDAVIQRRNDAYRKMGAAKAALAKALSADRTPGGGNPARSTRHFTAQHDAPLMHSGNVARERPHLPPGWPGAEG